MPTDEFIAYRKGPSAHLKEIGWKAYYGTTADGNLSQHKPDENPCGVDIDAVTMHGVTLADFHYYHIKCPYSTQADYHYVRNMNPFDANYMQLEQIDLGEQTSHTVTSGVMIRYNRGSKYGWLCVDDGCYYYTTVFSGSRYFYI